MSVRRISMFCFLLSILLTTGCAAKQAEPSADYSGLSAYQAVSEEAEARCVYLTDEEEASALADAKQDLLELEETEEAGLYTLEELTESYRYQLLFDKLSEIFVTDTGIKESDIRDWYNERYAALEKAFEGNSGIFKSQQEQYELYGGVPPLIIPEGYVRIHHILVADIATAENVLEELNDGVDFFEVINRYNIDEGMNTEPYRSLGYLIGPYDATRDYLPEMKEAALSLTEIGQISDIVESSAGFHIIRLDEKLAAGSVSYEAAHEKISSLLNENAREKAFEAIVKDWIG